MLENQDKLKVLQIIAIITELIVLVDAGLILLIAATGGFRFSFISFTTIYRSATILFLSVLVRIWLFIDHDIKKLNLIGNPISYVVVIFFYILSLIIANNYVAYVTFSFSSFQDLALYNQAMYNFVQGRGFLDQVWGTNLLGDHSELFLVPLSLIYIFWQSPLTLLYVQAIVVVSAVFPLYFFAKQRLGNGLWPVIISLSYLTFPLILSLCTWTEFRPITFIIPLLFTAFYYYNKDKKNIFVLLMLLSGLVKEEVPPVLATTGLYIIFFGRNKNINYKVGLFLFFAGIAMFLFMIKILIPYFGKAPYPHFARFIGGGDIFSVLYKNPAAIFSNSDFFSPAKLNFFYEAFCSTAFLPLFSLAFLIPISNWIQVIITMDASVISQEWHNTLIVTFIFISFVFGVSNLDKINKKLANFALLPLLLSIFFFNMNNFTERLIFQLHYRQALQGTEYKKKYDNLIRATESISNDSSVYTTFKLLPYVSNRKNLYWYPKLVQWSSVDYLFFESNAFLNNEEQDKLVEGLSSGMFAKIKNVGEFEIWKRL